MGLRPFHTQVPFDTLHSFHSSLLSLCHYPFPGHEFPTTSFLHSHLVSPPRFDCLTKLSIIFISVLFFDLTFVFFIFIIQSIFCFIEFYIYFIKKKKKKKKKKQYLHTCYTNSRLPYLIL